jgi:hypothetical protein
MDSKSSTRITLKDSFDKPEALNRGGCQEYPQYRPAAAVTARKDDAPAAVQAAFLNLAGLNSISVDGGLIQTTSG